jgi:hypothetical protein
MKTDCPQMRARRSHFPRIARLCALALVWLVAGTAVPAFAAGTTEPAAFATPEKAIDALIAAVRENDQRAILRILGPAGRELVRSGDPVADRNGRLRLTRAYDTAHRIEREGADLATLVVGKEEWSLPIPVVRRGGHWQFDTEASAQKIIDRRVGRNELNVIEVCRAYVAAQREYASRERQGAGVREYARRFDSSPGTHDGLYWEAAAGEEPSPLGPLMARARAEGYVDENPPASLAPYHGYFYRLLTGQGSHAPGGAKDYVAAGHMTGGFAMVAFPAKWGDSGIMTFLVNQSGIVFQKNLGPDTARLAAQITLYDPDLSWSTP